MRARALADLVTALAAVGKRKQAVRLADDAVTAAGAATSWM
ncbi:hypothetical protein [Kribbella sp. NBC_00359]